MPNEVIKIKLPFFKRTEKRTYNDDIVSETEALLRALVQPDTITAEKAMAIPSVKACVEYISSTIAMLPIKLYREDGEHTEEIKGDRRVILLNNETGDTLDSFQMKKAFVKDYLLSGAGYIYVNRYRNKVESLHYVDYRSISVNVNPDPIFKRLEILIQGAKYQDWQFIKACQNTRDGGTGRGIVSESNVLLSVAYNTLLFEQFLLKYGGNKKGFLQAEKRLSAEAMDELRKAWKELYANNNNNMMVLNDGITFKESSNTSVEMQLDENKRTNDKLIHRIFNVSPKVTSGEATDEEMSSSAKTAIIPRLTEIETAIDKALLLENEKQDFYFAFDTTELLKGDLLKRYQAYEIALRSNFLQIDEVRYTEDYKPLGFNFLRLGLNDVFVNPETKEVYTPNTNATVNLDKLKGGEQVEN